MARHTKPMIVDDSSGNPAGNVVLREALAGERNTGTANEYGVGVDECVYTVLDEADGTAVAVSGGAPAVLFGIFVNETLAASSMVIEDGTGNAVFTLRAGLAAGVSIDTKGAKFDTDITFNGLAGLSAGNITLLWRLQ